MPTREQLPPALTVAGSDSGGGAGIQADLKTFASLRVHGLSVITCVTAQSPRAVRAIEPCGPPIVRRQLETLLQEFNPRAAKTGMLYSEAIIRAVAEFFSRKKSPLLVVDPVMVSTSGRALMQPAACRALCDALIPQAILLTPNVPEAEVLLGRNIKSLEDLKHAAQGLHKQFGCAILAKGGHLPGARQAVDVFFDGKREAIFTAPFVTKVDTHGTGCTYSAAIVAYLARGYPVMESVSKAKRYITTAIKRSRRVSGFDVLKW